MIIIIVVLVVLLLAALGFGVWAFGSRQDYKSNVEQKIAFASEEVKKQVASEKEKEYVEKEKSPYRTYLGPETYAGAKIVYPKTWSAYVAEEGSAPLDGYFHPDFVPGLQSKKAYAVHIEVVNESFSSSVKQFDSKAKSGKVKVSPYKAPKMPGVLGARVDGEINTGQMGSMVLFPVRDKTLKISTQSTQFVNDFNNIILANLTFNP